MPSRKLRVAHVITRLELGGAQRNTLHTVQHLDRTRFEPLLVTGEGGILDAEARRSDVPVRFLSTLVRPIAPARDAAALLRLAALFRSIRPDIVHTHSSKAGILGRAAAYLGRVPVIVHTVHGFGFHPRQGRLRRRIFVAAERLVSPLTTHFIVVSEANREEGVRRGLFSGSRVTLIRSGVDLARFREATPHRGPLRAAGVPDGAPLVGMVGCLKPQKAPGDFVAVAARVAARNPAAHFALVGDGELRPVVEAAIRTAGLEGRFHLLGWRDDVDGLLKCFDVVAHTSHWEGLPRVFLEALAAGRPVVATGVDGAPDVIQEGVNGHLVEVGDLDGMADRIAGLLADPAARERLGAAGLPAPEEFEIRGMVAAQERLYRRLWSQVTGDGSLGEEDLARSRA
ncbi:MAG: glycosyltransferase family 4 protein [Acidobacteriota bacterium]|jgi:glycosyltransferase involved in cell wall biosynthesis